MMSLKRLAKDFKDLKKNPVSGANACPTDDMSVWHANIACNLTLQGHCKHEKQNVVVPMHLVIVFPSDYPASAPNAGFCTDFDYQDGASYFGTKPRDHDALVGKKVICLNILGNFADIHTEWKAERGTGWSSAMNVTTLLVSLQAILSDLDQVMSAHSKQQMYKDAMAYSCNVTEDEIHSGDAPYPPFAEAAGKKKCPPLSESAKSENSTKTSTSASSAGRLGQKMHRTFELSETLQEQLTLLHYGDQVMHEKNELITLLLQAKREGYEECLLEVGVGKLGLEGGAEGVEEEGHGKTEPFEEVAECFMTGSNYSEDTLGFGLKVDRNLIKTEGELLSAEAYGMGLRTSTMKVPFTHFLPAFITPFHVERNDWEGKMRHNLCELALSMDKGLWKALKQGKREVDFAESVITVLPNLINTMIVEIMKSQKAGAIAFFEALCSFWRTLRYFVTTTPSVHAAARNRLNNFVTSRAARHKDYVPDLGQLLALSTAMTVDGNDLDHSATAFIDAYLEESFTRNVMWWKRKGVSAEDEQGVFNATVVSRDLFLFQLTVTRCVLGGHHGDLDEAAAAMDKSGGKVFDRLERLQAEWKDYQNYPAKSWEAFLRLVGCSPRFLIRVCDDPCRWIAGNVAKAMAGGPKYGSEDNPFDAEIVRGGRGRGGRGRGGRGRGGRR